MNNISDQSNLCPICDTKNKKLLIEVDYKVIKKISNSESNNPELFKWLKCENEDCKFWTREPKR